jgi:CheY-like chemotaxis protein
MDQPKILVVEDDATIRKLVYFFARKRGIIAVGVATCAEALQVVRDDHCFSFILMDWGLPDKTGLECTALIRDLHRRTRNWLPIIAMTGNLMPGDREMCTQAGMDDFIGKPFSLAEFNALVDRWLNADRNILPIAEMPSIPPDAPYSGML